jgi:hypothetical protein
LPLARTSRTACRRIRALISFAKSDPEGQALTAAFQESLRWIKGRDISVEVRWASGSAES